MTLLISLQISAQVRAKVSVRSVPPGAEIFLDGTLSGNSPSVLSITPGSHTFLMKKSGYLTWERIVEILPESEISLDADLTIDIGLPDARRPVGPPDDIRSDKETLQSIYPALSFGKNTWTSVKFENKSAVVQHLNIESFSATGDLLENVDVSLDPGKTSERRLQPREKNTEMCWIRLNHTSQVAITVTVEVLHGNKIGYFERDPVKPQTGQQRWLDSAAARRGTFMYFLNLSNEPTVVGFCQAQNPTFSCRAIKPRFGVNSKASIMIPVRSGKYPHLIVESYQSHAGIVMYLHLGGGAYREFKANSSITFGSVIK